MIRCGFIILIWLYDLIFFAVKITSIELEPPDILLYVNASKDCDFKGVSKWEGGPDNTLLTFGNQSKHKNYQPVQRGRTFDLLIRNATQKEYNARYNFHLKFKNISAYLPTLPGMYESKYWRVKVMNQNTVLNDFNSNW